MALLRELSPQAAAAGTAAGPVVASWSEGHVVASLKKDSLSLSTWSISAPQLLLPPSAIAGQLAHRLSPADPAAGWCCVLANHRRVHHLACQPCSPSRICRLRHVVPASRKVTSLARYFRYLTLLCKSPRHLSQPRGRGFCRYRMDSLCLPCSESAFLESLESSVV